MIPYAKHDVTEDDINAVVEVLRNQPITQGPKIGEFEKLFAQYVGSKYAVAVSNGTAALHLSAIALGVKPNSKVISTPLSFVASTNSVLYCSGSIEFVDIEFSTYQIDFDKVESLLANSEPGTYSGIIPIAYAGLPLDLEKLRDLANKYNLWILEDSCHALGAYNTASNGLTYKTGSSMFSDLSIFSFHPAKHITTGEGGMITTNNEQLYHSLLKLRTHGITRNSFEFTNPINAAFGLETTEVVYPGWYMEMQELGYNYRITDFQCALGISQLNRIENNLLRRRSIAQKYVSAFVNQPWLINPIEFTPNHAYHLFVLTVEKRFELYEYLKKNSIFTQIHYLPIHKMPFYSRTVLEQGKSYTKSELFYSHAISLPMYPSLSDEEVDFVISTMLKFYAE